MSKNINIKYKAVNAERKNMKTKIIKIDKRYYSKKVNKLGYIIRNGGLIAFPTETVYGLGGNALNPKAAKKIYAAKGRPSDNPLIVHVADKNQVKDYVKSINELEQKLMDLFWPGPLTIVFEKKDIIPYETSGGLDTVAIRCPDNNATRALIYAAQVPLAGPSANISTRPSPTYANSVLNDLDGRINVVIDDGDAEIGLESTIVAVNNGNIFIYRPGAITQEMLSEIAPTFLDTALRKDNEKPKAPGMKYRHYAPVSPLEVYVGDENFVEQDILKIAQEKDKRYGFFVSRETADKLPHNSIIFCWGRRGDKNSMARSLFRGLLFFNSKNVEKIIGEGTDTKGIGMAIMNRLKKASGQHIVFVKK